MGFSSLVVVAGDVELCCFAGNGEALAFVARHVTVGDAVVEYTQLQSGAVVEPQRQLVVGYVEMFLTVKLGVDGFGDIASRARALYCRGILAALDVERYARRLDELHAVA